MRPRTVILVTLYASAALPLAACNRSGPAERAANRPNTAPMAEAPKTVGADAGPAKREEPFQSAVTGKPAPGGPQAADAELSREVKRVLDHAPDINMAGLDVASSDGVVTLYGTVDAPVEKDRAAMHAMEVDGVRSVVNNLVVVKGS